jgi:hypothetical protein
VRLVQLCTAVIQPAPSRCKEIHNLKGFLFDGVPFDNDEYTSVIERRFDIRYSSQAPSARPPLFRTAPEWDPHE